MFMKRHYIQPLTEIIDVEPFTSLLAGSGEKRTGYAIDNVEADPKNIISITEQEHDDELKDSFLEID